MDRIAIEVSKITAAATVLWIGLVTATANADESNYSRPVDTAYPTEVYWGDTHLHSSLSVDSSGNGNQRITPDMAYRFASGQAVRGNNGQKFKLERPLDFLVIADHAINLGVVPRVIARDPLVLDTEIGQKWRAIWEESGRLGTDMLAAQTYEEWLSSVESLDYFNFEPQSFFWHAWLDDVVTDKSFRQSVWSDVCAKADEYNQPGVFTAFIGFEWTPSTWDFDATNLHRNVVFRGDQNDACQVLPFSVRDSRNVEDLWAYMDAYESKTGDDVLAIPHNGNWSRGELFSPLKFDNQPLDMAYLKARRRWEPLVEMTQIKGDSETHPLISPTDEFADFETMTHPEPINTVEALGGGYARSGLKRGLDYEANTGVNPFKFGMLGSSDSHTGMSAVTEDNYSGKFTIFEPTPFRALEHWSYSASGLAAVWATGNTRTEIFDAMERREVYATTGTRISVRLFGGWAYNEEDATDSRFVDIGYRGGVPMGGDLISAPENGSPRLLIRAVKDPDGANLDRVQVIKGWRDSQGELHERVFDVALSDDRAVGGDSKVEAIKSTVDVENASYSNSVGEVEFALLWEDPEFNPEHAAFYYVRVIEIPTPRWTAYDAAHYGTLEKIPDEAPMVIQERAYTSPIWYTP